MKQYLLSLMLCVLFSCSSSKHQDRVFLGSISKNPNYKLCVAYDLHIYTDGTFVYIGGINSSIKGTHEGKLSKKELSKIKQLFELLPQNDSYIKDIDIPTITLKSKNRITIHKFNTPIFINFHSFVINLYDRIP